MKYALLIFCLAVMGCDAVRSSSSTAETTDEQAQESLTEETTANTSEEPQPVVVSNPGWAGAKKTIAGLGDPSKPGRWLETPLVAVEINGRVVVPKTGALAYVTLVPVPGPEGGGSRLSLEAMRALLLPFDELVELDVYSD